MNAWAVELEGVSKRYRLGEYNVRTLWETLQRRPDAPARTIWALRDVSLKVAPGETVGIIGRNGAGKSTLLKVIARITYPTVGTIRWRGRIASLLEVGTGFHPELTGRENIFLNGAILGMRRREIRRRLAEIVHFAGIESYLDTPVKRYSTGMVVRLAFSVAVHLDADILLVDEVLSVGDAFFQQRAVEKMRQVMQREGRTILFVSHNMGMIRRLCRRGVVIESGRVVYDASADEAVRFYLTSKRRQSDRPLSERADRSGSGRWRLRRVEVLDAEGRPVDKVLAGDPIRIRCWVDKNDPTVDPRRLFVGVVFWDEYLAKVAAFYSDEMGADFSFLNEADSFELEVPAVDLRPGRIGVGIHLGDGGTGPRQVLDYVEEATAFSVLPSDFWQSGRTLRPGPFALLRGRFRP